jgi:hypothetical protein
MNAPVLANVVAQMTISLCSIGGWMYLDVPATPNAVVVCVMCVPFQPKEACI